MVEPIGLAASDPARIPNFACASNSASENARAPINIDIVNQIPPNHAAP